MACLLTSSLTAGCNENTPGFRRILLQSKSVLNDAIPVFADVSDDGTITGLTLAGADVFYEFIPQKMSGIYTDTLTKDPKTGSFSFIPKAVFTVTKIDAEKHMFVNTLASMNDCVAIVEDKNGVFHLLGEENGLDLVSSEITTGSSGTELNGYTITLQGEERRAARIIDSGLIDALLGL